MDATKPSRKTKLKGAGRAKPTSTRNHTLDVLRGCAIVLMIIDHVAGVWFSVNIEPTSLRFITRLSMPLFSVLMGYFLAAQSQPRWDRFWQIAVAAIAINVAYISIYGEVEILASLLVCYCVHALLGPLFVGLFVAAYFFQIDPSAAYFDYPLSVVLSCVAQGAIIRRHGWRIGLFTSALVCVAIPLISTPTQYAIFFIPIATALVAWGDRSPLHKNRLLEFIGQHPLTIYLVQYAIVFAFRPQA